MLILLAIIRGQRMAITTEQLQVVWAIVICIPVNMVTCQWDFRPHPRIIFTRLTSLPPPSNQILFQSRIATIGFGDVLTTVYRLKEQL
jgi:hypothetical protein